MRIVPVRVRARASVYAQRRAQTRVPYPSRLPACARVRDGRSCARSRTGAQPSRSSHKTLSRVDRNKRQPTALPQHIATVFGTCAEKSQVQEWSPQNTTAFCETQVRHESISTLTKKAELTRSPSGSRATRTATPRCNLSPEISTRSATIASGPSKSRPRRPARRPCA